MDESLLVALGVLVTLVVLASLAVIALVATTAMGRPFLRMIEDEESDHYESTACFHGHHNLCRLECKHCGSPCRCECHEENA